MYLTAPTNTMDTRYRVLHKKLLSISFFNLLLVAISGLWLRSYPFVDYPLAFKNVLHGHSHFAFGGWVMPVLLALMLRYIPFLGSVTYRHWRNISIIMVGSSYGMLFSFPFGGYYLTSIVFSTFSVLSGFYLAWAVFKACREQPATPSVLFLKWAMVFGLLSSIGPFATGPLIALGYQGSAIYYNAIYFYLHFQYNGLFTFLLLSIFYAKYFQSGKTTQGIKVFFLLNSAIIPTFALSLLWTRPSLWFNIIGGWGAVLQLLAFIYLLKDLKSIKIGKGIQPFHGLVFGAFGLKLFLQLASAIPVVALLATEERNFIIAYLHLVLLGFISMFVFSVLWPAIRFAPGRKTGFFIFLSGFFATEILLALQAGLAVYHIAIPGFFQVMFLFSMLLPLGLFLFNFPMQRILSRAHKASFRDHKLSVETDQQRQDEWLVSNQ